VGVDTLRPVDVTVDVRTLGFHQGDWQVGLKIEQITGGVRSEAAVEISSEDVICHQMQDCRFVQNHREDEQNSCLKLLHLMDKVVKIATKIY
jgi:hypothetical protein